MDDATRKTVLRMIPYGLYVATARSATGEIAAATINWLTQASFEPPLLAVGLKAESSIAMIAERAGALAVNVLGRTQAELAYTFFKPVTHDDERISGERYRLGETGAPLLETAMASVEGRLVERVAHGDHHLFVLQAVAATLRQVPDGRPDDAVLRLADLGAKVFYGG